MSRSNLTMTKEEAANLIRVATGFETHYSGKEKTLWVRGNPESDILNSLNQTASGFLVKVDRAYLPKAAAVKKSRKKKDTVQF